jgi:hypothetical protein
MRHSTTEQRHALRQLATCVLCALALASLPGCGEQRPTEPEASAPQVAQPDELAADFTADQSAATSAAAGPVGATATRLPRSFFVNPITGSDANPGTQLKPFKTLAKGLGLAIAGDTMRLAAGLYSAAANGEKFTTNTQQTVVPAGVKIFGTFQGESTTFLQGAPGDLVGLNLQGAATVRNLFVTGFPAGVKASQGVQSFKNVVLDQNGFGLDLGGSAKATLTASTVFVRPGVGSLGARALQQAQLTLVGGRISAGNPNCDAALIGVSLADAARLTMKNGASLQNFAGSALVMKLTSKATLTGLAKVERDLSSLAGCTPFASVLTDDSASLTLKNARVQSTGGTNAIGIHARSRALLMLDSAQVIGHTGTAVISSHKLIVSNSLFQGNGVGIDGGNSPAGVTITGSTVSNSTFVGIRGGNPLKLRNNRIMSNNVGVSVGVVGTATADLGQISDPGNNTITGNSGTGVRFSTDVTSGNIFAAGNTWNAATQGSDASGHYPNNPLVDGSSPSAFGSNFKLPPSASFKIQL